LGEEIGKKAKNRGKERRSRGRSGRITYGKISTHFLVPTLCVGTHSGGSASLYLTEFNRG